VAPTSHVRFAAIQVLAATFLTKVEGILPEETLAVSGTMSTLSHATGAHNSPPVSSISTLVPEKHPSMTATLKELKSHKMPTTAKFLGGLLITPAMSAVVVDSVPIVNPQLAAIIGLNAEPILASLEDSQAACPAHGKVISSSEARPSFSCVAIVHSMAPTSHVWFATLQAFALATLAEIENVLPEEPMAICCLECSSFPATCTHNSPSVSGVRAFVPELYTSMTTTLKHFKFHKMPPSSEMFRGIPTTPTMQTIIVDRVPIVDPQLAAVI